MALELLVHLMWVTALINNHLKGILPMSPGVPSRLLKSVSQESIPIMYELPLIQICYPLDIQSPDPVTCLFFHLL